MSETRVNQLTPNRTKVVATIGPGSRSPAVLSKLIEMACPLGEEFMLVTERSSNGRCELTCSYREMTNDLKLGETILFADGTVAIIVTDTEPGRERLKVTLAGQLRSRQGLNLPARN